jgi:BlaI family penicillinase repressor
MYMKKKARNQALSVAQMEIMHIVWRLSDATVADVVRELRKKKSVARSTVQTMLGRLEGKGWLRHKEERNAFVYSATTARRKTLQEAVSSLVNSAFEGSAEALVMELLNGRGVSDDEAKQIQSMIDDSLAKREGGQK